MTNTKGKAEKETRVQIRTRQPGPVQPSGFSQLRRHVDLGSVDTVAEILSLPVDVPPRAEDTTQRTGNTLSTSSSQKMGNTLSTDVTSRADSTYRAGHTYHEGHTLGTGNTHSTSQTPKTSTTQRTGNTRRTRPSSILARSTTSAPVSPDRDFQKVPNSVTREMAARLFRGKSKQIYDYLWSQSRGAVTPTRVVRRSRPQLLRGADFGSMGTVERCIDFLTAVGLLKVRTIVGESEGNEYEIFTPEEVAPALLGLSPSTGNTYGTGETGSTLNQVLPVLPETGITGSTLSSMPPSVSGEPNTSFKTTEEKPDDEAFAGLVALLKRATGEVTGKESAPAEAERWTEVGELLVAELKLIASRTTVSSAPALLAEHLRRRLSKVPASTTAKPSTRTETPHERAAPIPPTNEELIDTYVNFRHSGMSSDEIDALLSLSVDPEQWPQIRQSAISRYEAERGAVRPPQTPEE